MNVQTAGHKYFLDNHQDKEGFQTIQFFQQFASETPEVVDGTTNEEVLAMLIDRMNFLNGKFPCRENSLAITKLEEALMWLNKRTENRTARGVEGTNQV